MAKIELITGIRILSKMHRVSAVRFLSLGTTGSPIFYPDTSVDPCELVKMHILFRDDLNGLLYGLGVDCYKCVIDARRPQEHNSEPERVQPTYRIPRFPDNLTNWYNRFTEHYEMVLDIWPIKPCIENTLLRQLSEMRSLLAVVESNPAQSPHFTKPRSNNPKAQRTQGSTAEYTKDGPPKKQEKATTKSTYHEI